jgi:hypothetical protein
LSAPYNPDVVGGILVVIVVGIIVLYALLDSKKRPNSTHYSSNHQPSGLRCKDCKSSNYSVVNGVFKCHNCGHTAYLNSQPAYSGSNERDLHQEGFEIGLGIEEGRQEGIRRERIRLQEERIREKNRKLAQEYYDNTTLKNLSPPKFDDPFPPKKQKKKRSIWDY